MNKAMISVLFLTGLLSVPAFPQDWGSGVAAPEPGRMSFTAGFQRLNQTFDTGGAEERLRRDAFRARADFRPGDVLSLYGFVGYEEISGSLDSLRALSYGGGVRLLFLGEVIVEERGEPPMEVKLGAALDFRAARLSPESGSVARTDGGAADGLTQLQAGLDFGLTVMGIGGYLGMAFTRNQGGLPYPAAGSVAPASAWKFSSTLGLQYKMSRHLGVAAEWSFFGLRSFGVGLRIYP
jgi:hypothetical protein